MDLPTLWFVLIAILWIGYFFLEGFDFGVGILLPVMGRTDAERRAVVNTIGPVWDGNEVWLLVAGGATFAAFPEWYAALFSGFYLALFLILLALIVRGVAFEFRSKRPEEEWRRRWDGAIVGGSLLPAILWGVAFANIVAGVPLDAEHRFTGTLLTLLNPFGLLGGLATLALFTYHGALFLSLKTDGVLRDRAHRAAAILGPVTIVVAGGFLAVAQLTRGGTLSLVLAGVAAVGLVVAVVAARVRRELIAFLGSGTGIAAAVAALFAGLYPSVLPSTIDPAFGLTVTNAASTPYTLGIMTVVALVFTPIVLLYQGWTYWVFRQRIQSEIRPSPAGDGDRPAASPGSEAR
jgi:cytochrome d ubiquinol oxidase subunit II